MSILKHMKDFEIQGTVDKLNQSTYLNQPNKCACSCKLILGTCNYRLLDNMDVRFNPVVYSKTCLKRPLKNIQNKDLYDKW